MLIFNYNQSTTTMSMESDMKKMYEELKALMTEVKNSFPQGGAPIKKTGYLADNILLLDFDDESWSQAKTVAEALYADPKDFRVNTYEDNMRIAFIF